MSATPSAQVAAAKAILDRAGIGKRETSEEDQGCVEDRVRKEAQELFERKMAYERRTQDSERP